MIIYETQKYGQITASKYGNGNYLVDNGRKQFELSEERFLEIINTEPIEINEDDVLIGLTHSPAVKSDDAMPINYWTLETKYSNAIEKETYIKYRNRLPKRF